MALNVVILAAGQGTRMRSELPKVLHALGGKPLLQHVYELTQKLHPQVTAIVCGYGAQQVLSRFSDWKVTWVEQTLQLGTGHAVQQALPYVQDEAKVLVLYGDVPLLRHETLERLLSLSGELGILTTVLENPTGYGRIVRDVQGRMARIVEEKDASAEEKTIREVNTGIMAISAAKLKRWLIRLDNANAQGEYYLTDLVALAAAEGVEVRTLSAPPDEVAGINDRLQLAELERVYQHRQAEALLKQGVTLRDPNRFDLRGKIETIGRDVEIDVNVVLEGRIAIGDRVKIGPNVILKDVVLGDEVEILAYSLIEQAQIGPRCRIGPFARIRPQTMLAEETHIGNFVEVKKSRIGAGSKVNHLSYIGDAEIGSHVNIGAGTITCNYDGVSKHRTIIEDGAFIGSDTQLVAPVRVGREATIGAGSTITKNAPAGKLTLSRCPQVTIEHWQRPTKRKGE